MDWEWVSLALMLVIFGAFTVATAYFSFQYGMEIGRQTPKQTARAPRAPQTPESVVMGAPCTQCMSTVGHHPECPLNKPKPRAERWKGFSRVKRDLENQPEKENSHAS